MNLIADAKITILNYRDPAIQEAYPEFFQTIRASDAWMKHLLYIIKELNKIPRNEINEAWNDYVDAKKRLMESFNETHESICELIVKWVIKDDHAHWATKT